VRNDGPQALDMVVVHRPEVANGIRYPVAATGLTDWEDQASLGSLGLTRSGRFTLALGAPGVENPAVLLDF